ncbi:MAG: helix-turn-helix domain-containing protein [Micromonosporaceae bacterium]
MTAKRRTATEAEARALASATRLRILRLCLDRALTNKEIAQRLDANPATTLHHVRTLVATGFLAAEQPRRGTRGAREVPYRATRKSWTLKLRDDGLPNPNQAIIDAYLQEMRLINPEQAHTFRLGLRLTVAERAELLQRIADLLDQYATRAPSADGDPYSLFVSVHPDVARD